MKIIDINSEIAAVKMMNPAAFTATGVLGVSVDLQGYQGKVKIVALIGAVTGTSPTLDIKVQDSADDSSYADVSPATAFSQLVTGSANSVAAIAVDVRAVRRYIKLYGTAGGTTPSFTMGVVCLGQKQTI